MAQMPSWVVHSSLGRRASQRVKREVSSVFSSSDTICGIFEDDLRLVVSDLVTNAITHAHTPFNVVLQRDGRG